MRLVAFRFQSAFDRPFRGARWDARGRACEGFADQLGQATAGFLAVGGLASVLIDLEDQDASFRHAASSFHPEAAFLFGCQRAVRGDVKAQLHRAGDFVDVLTTGAGRADEGLIQLCLINRQMVIDHQHMSLLLDGGPKEKPGIEPGFSEFTCLSRFSDDDGSDDHGANEVPHSSSSTTYRNVFDRMDQRAG